MATIRAMLGASALAVCPAYGADLMAMDWPDAPVDLHASAGAQFSIERGERYAVSRGLAVVPVRGMLTPNRFLLEQYMGWTTYHGLVETMRELTASDEVRGIVIEHDSPGGMVLGVTAAAEAIAAAAAVKPVHGLINPMCMSAAYWLASQCSDLTLSTGSELGSIGIMAGGSDPVQPGMDGWQDTKMRSTHARAKNADLSTEEGRALVQQGLDDWEASFHGSIASGRGIAPDQIKDVLSLTDDQRDGGALFSGPEAIARGLADRVEDRTAFYERVTALYAPKAQSGSRSARAVAHAAQALSAI